MGLNGKLNKAFLHFFAQIFAYLMVFPSFAAPPFLHGTFKTRKTRVSLRYPPTIDYLIFFLKQKWIYIWIFEYNSFYFNCQNMTSWSGLFDKKRKLMEKLKKICAYILFQYECEKSSHCGGGKGSHFSTSWKENRAKSLVFSYISVKTNYVLNWNCDSKSWFLYFYTHFTHKKHP